MKLCAASFVVLCLAAAGALALPSHATSAYGCASGYAYAGLSGSAPGAGVSAQLRAVSRPHVRSGHVAAWVGVGGEGLGPNGTNEWIQVGLSTLPGGAINLYYEVAVAGSKARYHSLGLASVGVAHDVGVVEVKGRPGYWRVLVNGKPVTSAIYLPASHNAWTPVATAESWDGGLRACNSFDYSFSNVAVVSRASHEWTPMRDGARIVDSGYRIVQRNDGFVATRA